MYSLEVINALNAQATKNATQATKPQNPIFDTVTVYRAYIGKNDGKDGKQWLSDQYIEEVIIKTLALYQIKGFTMFNAVGIWEGEKENTIVLELVNVDHTELIKALEHIKVALNQNAILLTAQNIVEKYI